MTAKELEEKGYIKENETTYGRPDSNEKVDVIKTDSGDYLVKNQGRNEVYGKQLE